ncbi:MAG TPA: alpha-amylase family glycosyl hydrolase [Rhodanobacteraceae bacterium]
MNNRDWWQGAIIYEIYPRSFQDSNGDGVGDLRGILDRLDYVAALGVDAIWIAPFFKSPMRDFGYDIADYRDVDPTFGTLADFDALLDAAHQRGLKVIIDQVPSHSSDQHPWFQQSRRDRANPKADWYVWVDPRADGTPPNNWLSLFGGSAWQWEPRRHQYYLHNFLASQPDLNFHHPAVVDAALDNLRFWLERGVDGFRLDSINFCFHDAQLRDNPPRPANVRIGRGYSPDSPYAYQFHRYNNTQPEMLPFLQQLRALLNEYPGTAALGEVSSDDSLTTMAEYTSPARLHMSYSFELLTDTCSAAHIRATVDRLEHTMRDGWPCWALSNHDCVRVRSRWAATDAPDRVATLYSAIAASLRGSTCLYQGEELALPEADVPYAALRDPYGIAFWPDSKGRDGCRTPMPWRDAAYGGFSSVAPWLPVDPRHRRLSVVNQKVDPASPLNRYRAFLRWRRDQPALRWGDIHFINAPEPLLVFTRHCETQTLLAMFNLGAASMTMAAPPGIADARTGCGLPEGHIEGHQVHVPAYGALFATMDTAPRSEPAVKGALSHV